VLAYIFLEEFKMKKHIASPTLLASVLVLAILGSAGERKGF
jgi:hypothetical protein